ncbi:MAG: dTDP-4-dehydrorhamnose reductase [bacterium]|nr:dTDP-4-dehydrorhamnose reductase [bacterium]
MSHIKIMITGANGQLGSDILHTCKNAGFDVFGYTHADADLADTATWLTWIQQNKPDIFINTAAFHHVDQCEADLAKAMLINCEAPAHIAAICKENQVRFIHISTDYVFDGEKNTPYLESDQAKPLNNYGLSKLKGEEAILLADPNALILRVSAIYGMNPCRAKNGLNFVQLMLKKASENAPLKVVNDEKVSPTSTQSIADKIVELLPTKLHGVVHLTSEGECSWYEFAKEIFDFSIVKADLSMAKSSDFPAKTPRPTYSVLENSKLKELNLTDMPHWREALHAYLRDMKK